jgi:hypothetical protein
MRQKWDQAFLSDMFNDTDHSIANVTAVYAYEVAIAMSDRTLAYKTLAVENALDPQHELWFADGVVGDLFLNMALKDERPNPTDLPPLELDTTVPYSCSGGFWGPVLGVSTVANGAEHTSGGTHGINGWVQPYCSYYPFYGRCYTSCRIPGYGWRAWDSGDTSWHWHCYTPGENYYENDGPGDQLCSGALGISVSSQPWPCWGGPSLGIQVWNIGVSVSGGSLWNGGRARGFYCPGR